MATRLTKFKYSLFAKGLCLILSALFFLSFAYSAILIVTGTQIYGFEEYISDNIPDYFNSYGFTSQFTSDFYRLRCLYQNNEAEIYSLFEQKQNDIINDAVNKYLYKKAQIIHDELLYAVNNYDDSYYNYEYSADAVDIPVIKENLSDIAEITTISEATTLVTDYGSYNNFMTTDEEGNEIPRNIEAAKIILEKCEGLEFLEYSALVRESAFTEERFTYEVSIQSEYYGHVFDLTIDSGYNLNEAEVKKDLLYQYNDTKESQASDIRFNYQYALSLISELDTLKYYVKNYEGEIITNDNGATTTEFINKAEKNNYYILYDGNTLKTENVNSEMQEYYNKCFKSKPESLLLVYIDNDMLEAGNDSYAQLFKAYDKYSSPDITTNLIIAFVSLFLFIISVTTLLCLSGHKKGISGITPAFIDSVPTDIHFLFSFAAAGAIIGVAVWLGLELIDSTVFSEIAAIYAPIGFSAMLTAAYLILIEWLTSTVRIKKAGERFFSKMLFIKGIKGLFNFLTKLFRAVLKFISVLRYNPGKMKRSVIILASGYTFFNILICVLTGILFDFDQTFIIPGIILLIAYNSAAAYFILKYIIELDKIIDASCQHKAIDLSNIKLPESLRILASNLTNTNDELEKAIQKAVKDEQMKTELITNVSHDLKTPLTSLISYSDLLSKCEINDTTALKYIKVINTQSIKLKRLIEDLIEASKASTGNITLNSAKLNLSELTMQVIAEFAPEIEKNGNEIIFNAPDIAPTIYADGAKTYRILANLLSNARKYSAPDTRIYISVSTDKTKSSFEIKNISSDPLNISPEELTERFVRGDESRSKEGNGLGLSIAKDLCALQNGSLKISIDGDLFKATVSLPCSAE